ncbi:MAG: acetate--CoA ligase [Myxococcota bacterium]
MIVPPKPAFSAGARVRDRAEYDRLVARAQHDPETFWREQSETLHWFRPPDTIVEHSEPGEVAWFVGGKLNAAVNCVDRHAARDPDGTALLVVRNEPGPPERIRWVDLKHRVGRTANLLRSLGVREGDRVCTYLPTVPELAVVMLACARIGAVHSVVFAGFSAEALRDRVLDAGARVVITADEGVRGPKTVPLKRIVDQALEGLTVVEKVLVVRRTGADVPMRPERDAFFDEEVARHRASCPAAWMSSEDPLFVLYTSGSTGRPKGLVHTTGGYLAWAGFTHRYVFDVRSDDVFFCAADVGWITGHSYIVYGPLLNGTTTVLFEGLPLWPDPSRLWQIVEQLQVTLLYTSPTALRSLMREGDGWLDRASRRSLRLLGSVGEPINPAVWQWYHDKVGEGRCPVVDTWWQTETGGVMIAPLPGAIALKPGSATLPLPGVRPVLVDEAGERISGNGVSGLLCLEGTWPGQARTIWGDHRRFVETYYTRFPGLYFTGDGCRRDEDGYYWITGRVDDVLNVSGHRLGTAEVESALVAHEAVAEAAVVGAPHEIKGEGIHAFVVLVDGWSDGPEMAGVLKEQVRHAIGPIATPDRIVTVTGLPKTRSGKILRRILRDLAAGRPALGDLSTLADPSVVAEIATRAGVPHQP